MKFIAVFCAVALCTMQLVHGDGSHESSSEEYDGCSRCSTGHENPCGRNSSIYQLGCAGTNKYLQCNNNTCTNQTCPTNEVWNTTLRQCATCYSPDFHVTADKQRCVCNQGTTFNFTSGSCVSCPTNSIEQPDQCSCSNTTVLDVLTYACRACPTGSTLDRDGDSCTCAVQTFWNAANWACESCPGSWVTTGSGRHTTTNCICNGTNQIFYRPTVSCFNCPTGITTEDSDDDSCVCTPNRGQIFNYQTQLCQCPPGSQPNAANSACQRTSVASAASSG